MLAVPFFAHPQIGATRASWSRDTGTIAFTAEPGEGAALWLLASTGKDARPAAIEGLSESVYYPSWFRGGRSLAVVDFEGDSAEGGVLKRVDLETRTSQPLTDRKTIRAGMPSVSVTGRIAFAGQKNEGAPYDQSLNSIWILGTNGALSNPDRLQGRTPAWSPDGQWLAFESNRGDPAGRYAIFVMHPDGTHLARITRIEDDANHPAWSPDGTQLVFSASLRPGSKATGIAIIDLARPGALR